MRPLELGPIMLVLVCFGSFSCATLFYSKESPRPPTRKLHAVSAETRFKSRLKIIPEWQDHKEQGYS
jgi:hypothetical protein